MIPNLYGKAIRCISAVTVMENLTYIVMTLLTKQVTQLTKFNDFPISSLEGTADEIIFSQGGYLHVYNASPTLTTQD